MSNDGFTTFENRIAEIASRYKAILLVVIGVLLSVLILAMLLGLICIPIAFSLAEQNQTERYNAHYPPTSEHYVSEETITNWNNIVVPTVMFFDGYLANATLLIAVSYVAIVLYFLIRWIYRMRNQQQDVVIE